MLINHDDNENNDEKFRTKCDDYTIQFKKKDDSLIISLYNKYILYKSVYSLKDLRNKFTNANTIDDIIQEIRNYSKENKIEIKKNEIIFKTNIPIVLKLDISLKSITKFDNYITEKIKLIIIVSIISLIGLVIMISLILNNEIEKKIKIIENSKIKEIDKRLKNKVNSEEIKDISNKLKKINDSLIELKENNDSLTKDEENNEEMDNTLITINNTLNTMNTTLIAMNERLNKLKDDNEKMNNTIMNLLERISKLERYQVRLTNSYLSDLKNDTFNINYANSLPSGNIILGDSNKNIFIYDFNYGETEVNYLFNETDLNDNIQYLEKFYLENNNNNSFISTSGKKIIIWNYNGSLFEQKIILPENHTDRITKVIYDSKGKLFSCSEDDYIIIWEKKNENYEIKKLNHRSDVYSILLYEDKNILISYGPYSTIIWNLTDNSNVTISNDSFSESNNGLDKIDDDKFIVLTRNGFSIISITEKQIIKTITKTNLQYSSLKSFQNKGIFLLGGKWGSIYVYRIDNFELIQTIKNAHNSYIIGFFELQDGQIASYSEKEIKIWAPYLLKE